MVLGVECDQDFGVAGAHGPVRSVRQVNAGVGQADIVENGLQLSLRDFPADDIFHFVAQASGFFHA
jgi:hypothetical protein